MRPYYEDYSSGAKLGDMVNDIDFLQSKALNSQSIKMNNKLKHSSRENEKPLLLIEALSREYKLLLNEIEDSSIRNEFLEQTWEEQKKALRLLDNSLQIEYLKEKISVLVKKSGVIRSEEDQLILHKLMNEEVLSDIRKCFSTGAEINWYLINARAAILECMYEKASKNLGKAVAIFDVQPALIKSHPSLYLEVMIDFTHVNIAIGKLRDASVLNSKIRRLPENLPQFRTELSRSKIFIHTLISELMIRQQGKEFSKGLDLLDFHSSEIDVHLNRVDNNLRLNYLMRACVISFCAKEFRKSLHFMKLIINDKYDKQSREFENFIRIFNLIIHYQLGNKDHLYYAIKSAHRHFTSRDCMRPTEKVLIAFLRNYINKGRRMQPETIALRTLSSQLKVLREDPFESRAYKFFDFIEWVDSKANHTIPFTRTGKIQRRKKYSDELMVVGGN